MRDMLLEKVVKSWKIVDVLTAGLQDSLAKNLEKKPFYVIELLNPIKQSEHLAIISQSGAIYEPLAVRITISMLFRRIDKKI